MDFLNFSSRVTPLLSTILNRIVRPWLFNFSTYDILLGTGKVNRSDEDDEDDEDDEEDLIDVTLVSDDTY